MKFVKFFIFIAIGILATNAFAANDIYFSPDSLHIQPGDEIVIDVMVADMDPIFGAAIEMYFIPEVLEFVQVMPGDLIPAPILLGDVMYGNLLTVGLGTSQGECVPGSGTLFSIKFQAINDGSSSLLEGPNFFWNCEVTEENPFETIGTCIIHVGATDAQPESWGKIKSNFKE